MTEKEKMAARRKVSNAVKTGRLVRPSYCPKCGSADLKGRDGRSTMHAHHHKGYEYPLDIEWLCVKCHFQFDPRAARESNGRAKLTADSVADIRRRYKSDAKWWNPVGGAKTLAREFGVSDRTVRRIVKNEIWIDAALNDAPSTVGSETGDQS